MRYELQDFAIRGLFILAGVVAATLLAMKGYGEALPGVAIGGAFGAFLASRAQPAPEE